MSYTWITVKDAEIIHEIQLTEHGGSFGVPDRNLLESALMRPQMSLNYGKPTLFELAAPYAFGITRNHPFLDGNKRVALVVAETFLGLHGVELTASDEDCVRMMHDLAAGNMTESELAVWFEAASEVPQA